MENSTLQNILETMEEQSATNSSEDINLIQSVKSIKSKGQILNKKTSINISSKSQMANQQQQLQSQNNDNEFKLAIPKLFSNTQLQETPTSSGRQQLPKTVNWQSDTKAEASTNNNKNQQYNQNNRSPRKTSFRTQLMREMESDLQHTEMDFSRLLQIQKARNRGSSIFQTTKIDSLCLKSPDDFQMPFTVDDELKIQMDHGLLKHEERPSQQEKLVELLQLQEVRQLNRYLFFAVLAEKFPHSVEDFASFMENLRESMSECYTRLIDSFKSFQDDLLEKVFFMMAYVIHKLFYKIFPDDREQLTLRFVYDCYNIVIAQILGIKITDCYIQRRIENYFTHKFLDYTEQYADELPIRKRKHQSQEEEQKQKVLKQQQAQAKKVFGSNFLLPPINQLVDQSPESAEFQCQIKELSIPTVATKVHKARSLSPLKKTLTLNVEEVLQTSVYDGTASEGNNSTMYETGKGQNTTQRGNQRAAFDKRENILKLKAGKFISAITDRHSVIENICASSRVKAAGLSIASARQQFAVCSVSPLTARQLDLKDGCLDTTSLAEGASSKRIIFHPIDRILVRRDVLGMLKAVKSQRIQTIRRVERESKLSRQSSSGIIIIQDNKDNSNIIPVVRKISSEQQLKKQYGVRVDEVARTLKYDYPQYRNLKMAEAALNKTRQKIGDSHSAQQIKARMIHDQKAKLIQRVRINNQKQTSIAECEDSRFPQLIQYSQSASNIINNSAINYKNVSGDISMLSVDKNESTYDQTTSILQGKEQNLEAVPINVLDNDRSDLSIKNLGIPSFEVENKLNITENERSLLLQNETQEILEAMHESSQSGNVSVSRSPKQIIYRAQNENLYLDIHRLKYKTKNFALSSQAYRKTKTNTGESKIEQSSQEQDSTNLVMPELQPVDIYGVHLKRPYRYKNNQLQYLQTYRHILPQQLQKITEDEYRQKLIKQRNVLVSGHAEYWKLLPNLII